MENVEVRIKSTLLSQKPREESLLIALLSVMVLLFVSLMDGNSILVCLGQPVHPRTPREDGSGGIELSHKR